MFGSIITKQLKFTSSNVTNSVVKSTQLSLLFFFFTTSTIYYFAARCDFNVNLSDRLLKVKKTKPEVHK